ncbi:MAG TPA: DMT family transporter [Lacunisphaera sp.]|nr:DMT family transporter [Lacunisphaera sp.]
MLGALFTTLCFAVTPVFANRAAQRLGSSAANAARLLIATLLFGFWAHLFGGGFGGPAVGWFFAGGLAGFGVGGLAMFQSLPRLGSNLSTLIVQCGSAVVAAVFEWGWLGVRLSAWQSAAIAVTLAGVLLGLLPRSLPRPSPAEWAAGLGWAFLSAAGQGAGAVLSRKAFAVARALGEPVDAGTASYQRALAGLLVAAAALVVVRLLNRDRPRAAGRAWPWVLANATSGPLLGVVFFQWALSTTPAGIVQAIVATAPLLTIPFANRLEGGPPRRLYYAGAALAVTGVAGLMLAR